MKFDASKPHGLVYGVPGAAYEQNGQLYSPIGEPFAEAVQDDLAAESRAQRGQSSNQQANNRKDK